MCVFVYWNIQYIRAFWYTQRHVLFYYIKIFHTIFASFSLSSLSLVRRARIWWKFDRVSDKSANKFYHFWYRYFIKFAHLLQKLLVYIYMHTCTYVCMHVYVRTYMYVCLRVYMNSLAQRNQIFLLHVVEHYFELFVLFSTFNHFVKRSFIHLLYWLYFFVILPNRKFTL